MARSRHLGRVLVLQTLFAFEFKGGDANEILRFVVESAEQKPDDLSFIEQLLNGILAHKDQIIEKIQKFAPQWPVDKIAPVDRAALEIGLYELLFDTEVPDVVAINEAIELAKSFGSDNAGKFVNGVLNSALQEKKELDSKS